MKRWFTLVCVVATLCPSPSRGDEADGAIGGTVRSSKTGEPLKSVQIALELTEESRSSPLRGMTGPAGDFLFSGLPPGQYRLRVRKGGYHKVPAAPIEVSLGADEKVKNLHVALLPAGVISGFVFDPEGEPVEDARVVAYRLHYQDGGVLLSPAARTETDDLGEYRLYDLVAGKYVVSVSPPRLGTPMGELYANFADVYYPGAPSPSQGRPLRVSWGQELTGVDLELSDEPTYQVAGAVFDGGTGSDCFDCVLRISRLDGEMTQVLSKQVRVSTEGAFTIRGLGAGTYKLSVQRAGDHRCVGQRLVEVSDQNVDVVTLLAETGRKVSGKIVFTEDGVEKPQGELAVSLFAVNATNWPIPRAAVDEQSAFHIEAVPAETYRFELLGLPAGAHLKALRVGGQNLPGPEFTIPEDSPITKLEARITFDGAVVSGRVRSRRPGSGEGSIEARIMLVPKPNRTGYTRSQTVHAAPDGRFTFASVVPGVYSLYAVPTRTLVQIHDPSVQAALRPYSQTLDLGADEKTTVDVPLAPDPSASP